MNTANLLFKISNEWLDSDRNNIDALSALQISHAKLGEVKSKRDGANAALSHLEESSKLSKVVFNSADSLTIDQYCFRAIASIELGRCLLKIRGSSDALPVLVDGLKFSDEAFKRFTIGRTAKILSVAHQAMGQALMNSDNEKSNSLSHFNKSIEILEELYESSRSPEDLNGLISAYQFLGFTYHENRDYLEAIKYYDKMKNYCHELFNNNPTAHNKRNLALAYQFLSGVYFDTDQYEPAQDASVNFLKLASELYDDTKSFQNMDLLATAEEIRGTTLVLFNPKRFFERSLQLRTIMYETEQSDEALKKLSSARIRLGESLVKREEVQSGLSSINAGLKELEFWLKNESSVSRLAFSCGVYEDVAQSLEKAKMFEESIPLLVRCQDLVREILTIENSNKNRYWSGKINLSLGFSYFAIEKYNEAIKNLDTAIDLSENLLAANDDDEIKTVLAHACFWKGMALHLDTDKSKNLSYPLFVRVLSIFSSMSDSYVLSDKDNLMISYSNDITGK